MTRLTMSARDGGFLLSEASGYRSRTGGVLRNPGGAAVTYRAGLILGMLTIGALAGAGAAVAGNTGAATITASPAVAVGTRTGVYTVTAVSAGATAAWLIESPDGVVLGEAVTGTPATVGGIGPFTITDAGTDPAVGDQFTITVTDAAVTGEGQYVIHDPEGANGSQNVAGILFGETLVDAAGTAKIAVVVRDAEVVLADLVYDDHSEGEKTAVVAALAALGIIARS
jgi:hypothetical protein